MNLLALAMDSSEVVDEAFSWAVGEGIDVLYGGPVEMGTDHEPNYAVFLEDPDRVKIELVYRRMPTGGPSGNPGLED